MNNFIVFVTSYEEDPVGNTSEPKTRQLDKQEYFHLLSLILFDAYETVHKIGSKASGMGILPKRILQWKDDYDSRVVYEFEYYEDGRKL